MIKPRNIDIRVEILKYFILSDIFNDHSRLEFYYLKIKILYGNLYVINL
jgi:hypothetical protein